MNFDPDVVKAHYVLARVAMRGNPFTSDDIRDVVEREAIPLKIPAIGKALAEARVAGYIVQIGEQPSRRESNHHRKLDVCVLASDVTGKPVTDPKTTPTASPSGVIGAETNNGVSQPSIFPDTPTPVPAEGV